MKSPLRKVYASGSTRRRAKVSAGLDSRSTGNHSGNVSLDTAPTATHKCNTCKIVKPVSEFYGNGNGKCKGCTKAASVRWRSENPSAKKAIDRKYKASEKGKATVIRGYKRWYRKNTARVRAYVSRYQDRFTDAYVAKRLKERHHIDNATPEQIAAHRILIHLLRARKTMTIIAYATRNPQR